MNKIRSRKGASLAETLVTVLILSLAFAAAVSGITASYHVYQKVREKAAAETLLSTSIIAVSNELYSAQIDDTTTGSETTVNMFYNDSLHMYEIML
jgi:type II secretory pathway pseudopilin PulG